MNVVRMGPQTPECTISKGFVATFSSLLAHFAAYCLPSVHASQTNEVVGGEVLTRFMPFTMLCTTYISFTSNHPVNPFDKSLLTESKLACNFGTWSTSVMRIVVALPLISTPTTMDPIPMASAALPSFKRTLRGEITS